MADLLEKLTSAEAQLAASREQSRVLEEANRRLLTENEGLKRKVDDLCRRLYGKKSEQVDPAQLALALKALAEETAATEPEPAGPEADTGEALAPAPRPRKGHRRRRPAKDLPRVRVEHLPAEEDCVCATCRTPKVVIGEELSEQYDYEPSRVRVLVHARQKLACPTCREGVVVAPPPPKVVEKGLATAGLIAHVLVSKFADHLPLYRQAEIFRRQGADLSEATMLAFVRDTARLLDPVVEAIHRALLSGPFVHADETTVKVRQVPSGVRTSYFWALTDREQVLFRFAAGRGGEFAKELLRAYVGFVHRDAYAGYETAMDMALARWIACWAHARRKFHEALGTAAGLASRMLALIALLYRVEAEARGMGDVERRALRQLKSVPVLAQIELERTRQEAIALPRSALGEALTYMKNQWPALIRYVDDGMLAIDNNVVERAIRPLTIGRNNWVTAGSDDGARWAAVHYTLVGSCKMQGIDPYAYLKDVLEKVSGNVHKQGRVDELTPKGWKTARARAAQQAPPPA